MNARILSCAGFCLALACAQSPWPDEPGVPTALSQADNVQAGDAFLTALTNGRRSANLPAPIVAPRYQSDIRPIAEDLQAGKVSVAGATRALEAWGKSVFKQEVKTYAIDCAAGERMPLPTKLVEMPAAVISYAVAHFRPRSLPADQCAVLVVALTAGEAVEQTRL